MREKKKSNKQIIYLLFSILAIVLTFVISESISKYVIEVVDKPHTQESTAFYFESEIASVEGKEYIINNWDGETTKTIEIDVKNYINSLLKTNENITYKVKAEIIDDTTEDINDEGLIEVEIYAKQENESEEKEEITELQECILTGSNFSEDKFFLNVIPKVNNIENGKVFNIEVTISSVEPYTKEIKTNIQIDVNNVENYTATLEEAKNEEYVVVNLKVNNVSKDIKVQYDNTKLVLDKSGNIVNNVEITKENNTSTFTVSKDKLEVGKSYEIVFVKKQESITWGTDVIVE